MKRLAKILSILFLVILLIVLIGLSLIPIPPLEGALPPEQLADPDSRFVEVNGLKVHYKDLEI